MEQFLEEIKEHPTLAFSEASREFSIKKKYPIGNKSDLRRFIYANPCGL